MKVMRTAKYLIVCIAMAGAFATARAQGQFPRGTVAGAPGWTNPVEAAYAAIWDGFYGLGKGKLLLKASPELLPEGKPFFKVDAKTDEISLQIRIDVDTAAFEAWRHAAHQRLAALGMSQCRIVAFGAPNARIIGGKAFLFSDEGEAAVQRWEMSRAAHKAAIAVRVEGFTKKGKPLLKWEAPLRLFTRGEANMEYPFPLRQLNRLLDVPPSIWNWLEAGVAPDVDAEHASFQMPLAGLSPLRAQSIATIKCSVIDEADFMPELIEAAPEELLKLEGNMVAVPGRSFLMGRYEVTQALWENIMEKTATPNPSRFKGPDLPVENVSWEDCRTFLIKLNSKPIVKLRGQIYRFPTEEEWEYACRAGAGGAYCRLANGTEVTEGTLDNVAWFADNCDKQTHPVGQKEPNAFGLYDMHGNVWEWTSTEEETDRVTKGGGWNGDAGRCESSNRNRFFPSHCFAFLGFRLVRHTIDPR